MRADPDGRYPVAFVCDNGNLPILKALAQNGADLSRAYQRGPPGMAISIAKAKGHQDIVDFLQENTQAAEADTSWDWGENDG